MNRRIILVLIGIIAIGCAALYAIQRSPLLLLRPPADERIAFVSDRGVRHGGPDIWTMRTDGSNAVQVTNDSADDCLPAWSPDARELASTSDRREGRYQVFVSAWNGSYTHCLTISEGTKDMPVWSADGKEITFISSGRVHAVRRHGGREEQYLPPPNVPEEEKMAGGLNLPYVYAAWSPDRKALLFVQETDLGRAAAVVESDGLTNEEVFQPFGITIARGLDAAWAPSGQRVAAGFINRRGESGLLVADLEAVQARNLFIHKGDGKGAAKPTWSPDGKRIAFEMWTIKDGVQDRRLGIYVISASGGKAAPVISGNAREPSWSPDGKRLVCAVVREDGGRDIWRVNADGSGAVNLTKGRGDNYNPVWSPALR